MRLENWSCTYGYVSPYTAPEQLQQRLAGEVYDHPNFPDGDEIVTSSIIAICDGRVMTRSGSMYDLGVVDPAYEEKFPNARNRLLNVKETT